LTRNEADALDATQEALLAIARGLDRFDGRSSFSTWSYRVATNATFDELRRQRRRPADPLPEHHDPIDDAPAIDTTVSNRLALDQALDELPDDFRAAVVLRDLADLDYAEIAETLDIPIGTVRSRIARGRAGIARMLSGNQSDSANRPSTRP